MRKLLKGVSPTVKVDEAQVYIYYKSEIICIPNGKANCTANSNIKKALDCGYNNKNHTMSLMAEVNTLLKKCLLGQDDCKKCSLGYKCPYISYTTSNSADYRIRTIANPFYGRYDAKDCLILKIK
ncbi:hypothetical protein DOY81_001486 [Sarcophaga bullata]|nr:hypothetical protein DOY81_001486 [Sarcophaga bullata]